MTNEVEREPSSMKVETITEEYTFENVINVSLMQNMMVVSVVEESGSTAVYYIPINTIILAKEFYPEDESDNEDS